MERTNKFENFVSLGYICPVAASMSKYGLRSWSGVFDWLITKNLQGVLHSIENEFEDFIQKENLEHFSEKHFKYFIDRRNLDNFKENPKHFIDRNGDFVFLHEKNSFATELEKIQAQYLRKIEKFLSEITKPTCFFRAVADDEEIVYIKENFEYINRVIKKKNEHNEIVFLIKNDTIDSIKMHNFPFRFFATKENTGHIISNRDQLRAWFDEATDLLEFCASNFNSVTMMRNIMFDHSKEKQQCQQNQIIRQRYDILLKVLDMDLQNISLPLKAIIYGAGNIGRHFYYRVKEKCEVVAFCDESLKGTRINNLPILDLEEIQYERKIPFIVTATYDFENIYNKIKYYDKDAVVISLEEILRV